MTIDMLPDVLVVRVLQYVPLFDRLSQCSTLSRTFNVHSCQPTAFAADATVVSEGRLIDFLPLVRRVSCCSTFSLLAQLERSPDWPNCLYVQAASVLSFVNLLPQPNALPVEPSASCLRYLFLSGSAVGTFASSLLRFRQPGRPTASPLAHLQCVYFSSAQPDSRIKLPWSALHLLLLLRSLSVVYVGHYTLKSQQFSKLIGLPVRRLDFSTCRVPWSINTRQWALCPVLESLLLAPFTDWGQARDPGDFAIPTLRLARSIAAKTATTLQHLSVSGVFERAAMEQLTQLNQLVSLDVTCLDMKDWSMFAVLVGEEEDGQRYSRLRQLRHIRLSAARVTGAMPLMAAESDAYTQALRALLVTYVDQLETADVMAIPTTLNECKLTEPWLLSSMPKLRRLEVRGMELENVAANRTNWPHRTLVCSRTRLPRLHTLVVRGMQVRDKAVMDVLTAAPQLQHVTLDSCPLLTPATLLALATFCPSLISVHLLSCNLMQLTGAAFDKAHTVYPTLFLPATADAQLGQRRPIRQCSLLPETIFARLHTFVYQLTRAPDHGVVDVDEAGLAVLGGLFAHAPLHYFHFHANQDMDWLTFPHALFSPILTLRSYAVCPKPDGDGLHYLMQPYLRHRMVEDASDGRMAAEQSLVMCDETRYGGEPMSAEQLECSVQHWKYFMEEFRSVDARTEFWEAAARTLRWQQQQQAEDEEGQAQGVLFD